MSSKCSPMWLGCVLIRLHHCDSVSHRNCGLSFGLSDRAWLAYVTEVWDLLTETSWTAAHLSDRSLEAIVCYTAFNQG
ncbi:hypothetical protein Lal_00026567 [Lupinus albus]|nr:hypothetical protein Lal_00026567 [Lupinus albus]